MFAKFSTTVGLRVAAFMAIVLVALTLNTPPSHSAGEARVGVFDTRAVALAYGRSEQHEKALEPYVVDARKAKEKGDKEAYDEIDAKMIAWQEQMHEQVFNGAPIDNILAEYYTEKDWRTIAEKAGVDLILCDVLYRAPDTPVVDITKKVVEVFNPDEKTWGYIDDVMKR
jgi:hypothetical protein